MNPTNCARCNRGFYVIASESKICCPFCGYSFMKTDKSEKRLENRKLIKKACVLANGFGMITASAVDISEKGLGLVINGKAPFKKSDKLIASLEAGASWYRVKWIKTFNDNSSKAGLEFYQTSFRS